jgi:subtilase family serine protease
MINKICSRSLALCTLASVFLCSAAAMAQRVAPAVRIVGPINQSQLVTLHGSTLPAANASNDRGPVSTSLPMADMVLVLSRSPEQQAAFDTFVASQYDSSSPNYHQWLTPAEVGERFGPAQADISTLTAWLAGQGFTVTSVSRDRMAIHFSGVAAQAESAFHVEIHNLSVNGVPHIANMTDPQIPAALSTVVLGVKGLHNFLPHPLHKVGSLVKFNSVVGKWQRVATATAAGSASVNDANPAQAAGLRPLFGIGTPASGNYLASLEEDVSPYDFATIYNVLPVWNSSITGANQTIAIAGTSDICLGQSGAPCNSTNDVSAFRSSFGLPAGLAPEEVKGANGIDPGVCTGSTNACNSGDLLENSLDVEWSGAVGTGAQIVLVTSGYNSQTQPTNDPIYESAQYVINNHGDSSYPTISGANILSVSYGVCELFNGTSSDVAYNNLWQSAASEGISVFVATGDSGSATCDAGGDSNGNPYSAQFGLTVSGLASTPYNTAVGGTDFSWCKPVYNSTGSAINGCPDSISSPGPYWNTSNNSTTGVSAAGYVPETPWNDTCMNPIQAAFLESLANLTGPSVPSNPEAACDYVQNYWYQINAAQENAGYGQFVIAYFVDTVGGSGGASSCVANNTDTYTGTGVPSCTSGATSTGVTTNPTTGNSQASLTLYNNGWPKPSWQNTSITGVPSDGVRDIPDVSFFAGDGSLDSATLVCASIVAGEACSASSTNGNGTTTMLEVGGTSVGTPEMAGVMSLINQKIGTPQGLANPGLYSLAQKQNYSSCSAETVTAGSSSCYFNDVDQGTNAMPCDYNGTASEGGAIFQNGSWLLFGSYQGLASPNCAAINSGDTVGTLVSSGVTPAYNATMGYDMATGLGSLNVANVVNNWTSLAGTGKATLSVTPNSIAGPISIAADASLTLVITVTGAGQQPTGSVTVAGGGFGTTQSLTAGTATIVIPANSLPPGSQTLTVTYSGDANYASTSTTESLTVAADSPTVEVSAPPTQNLNNSFTVTVAVSGPVGAPIPTGNVSLAQMGGAYSSAGIALNSSGTAAFTIPANALSVGNDTLTATYVGVSPYSSGTGSAPVDIVNIALLTPTVTVMPGSTSLDSSQALVVTAKVTGSGATPTGTVTLTSPSLNPAPTATLDVTGTSSPMTIPANSLAAGSDTLKVSYSGDATYATGTGNVSVTVTQSTYGLSASTPAAISPGSSSMSTITGTASKTLYTGTVALSSCALTSSSVTNPTAPPSCSVSGTITYASGTASGSGTAAVFTTAASTSGLVRPSPAGKGRGWLGAGSGAILAVLIFLWVPKRRHSWRSMLGMALLLAALGSLSACGGSSGTTTTTTPGTSAGTYTFTVSGTGSDPAKTTESTTFMVTVN